MIASHRQNRPQMPKDWCPFCPGSGKVPEHYDVYKYDNDFPALSENPPEPDDVAGQILVSLTELIDFARNRREQIASLQSQIILICLYHK